ncbi:MAG: methyltransferase domain-containing protein [Ilumatobacteraceae bacterium]
MRVLDVGGADVNGSYRSIFASVEHQYTSLDVERATGVDIVVGPDGRFPLGDGSFDVVICGQTFEHVPRFWDLFGEIMRVVARDGVVIVAAPSAGAVHRYPVDCYRFHPDGFVELAKSASVHVGEILTSSYGPWFDTVAVIRHSATSPSSIDQVVAAARQLMAPLANDFPVNSPHEAERGSGSASCESLLATAHRHLEPRFYLEIGVEYGVSLRLSQCAAIGVDPCPVLNEPLAEEHNVIELTSDDFFDLMADRLGPLDLVYVDGMHRIENALKDFMNVERSAHKLSVVVIDDVFPVHPLQAERERQSRHWTGDVWKMLPILRRHRPDLILIPVDTYPTGSLVVVGLSPTSDRLWCLFDTIVDLAISSMTDVPTEIIERHYAVAPDDPLIGRVFDLVRLGRDSSDDEKYIARIAQLVNGAFPRTIAP